MNRKRTLTTLACAALLAGGVALFLPTAGRGQDYRRSGRLTWEDLPSTINLHRAKVPGGWLVALEQPTSRGASFHMSCAFYPDPNHEWDGGSLR